MTNSDRQTIVHLSNQVTKLNDIIDDFVDAGKSLLETVCIEHDEHSEVKKLAEAINAASYR